MRRLAEILLVAVGPVLVFSWLTFFGGAIEGRALPVVTDVSLTKIEADGDTHIIIWGEFYLHRDDCSFGGVAWELVGANRSVLLDLQFFEPSKVRAQGWEKFGPWRLQATEEQLPRTEAIAFHNCPARPYQTETQFFTGSELP